MELIKITQNENQEPCVSGRELHKFLEVNERYNDWFPRMVEYGFSESIDFMSFTEKSVKPQGGRPSTDHMLKLDMAKELAMIQRTEKGKQARQYFIQVEKEYNSPEKIMARALVIAQNEINNLTRVLEVQAPKVSYHDKVLQSDGLLKVTDISKDYGMSAVRFNRLLNDLNIQYKQGRTWYLYSRYQDCNYTKTKTSIYEDSEGVEHSAVHTYWTQSGRKFLYEKLKEVGVLPLSERTELIESEVRTDE